MTDQRELDRLLGAYLAEGTNELADRVLDGALDEIDHTHQRRAVRAPWRFLTMPTPIRLAAAAAIGVLAVGGAFYLIQPRQSAVGPPAPTPSAPAVTPGPSAAAASVQPSDWRTTGAPAVDRDTRGITIRLLDGRVLVAGGGTDALDSAELYDPVRGTWSATGSMNDHRSYPIAVMLANGKVLVAGGDSGTSNMDTAEIFDPATGVWTRTGQMTAPRQQAFASLLSDGKVLVAGGGSDQGSNKTAEIYDPTTGLWTPTGDMTAGRAGPLAATLLRDGRVLVAGGFTADKRSAEIWEKSRTPGVTGPGAWATTGQMHAERGDEQTAVVLTGGKVLIMGGRPSSADLFDPATGAWTATGAMTESYTDLLVSVVLPDRTVLLVGGGSSRGGDVATAEIFDPTTSTWSAAGTMTRSRFVRSATLLPGGSVLVVGTGSGGTPTAELYDPGGGS